VIATLQVGFQSLRELDSKLPLANVAAILPEMKKFDVIQKAPALTTFLKRRDIKDILMVCFFGYIVIAL
jgi:hypothetical protein